MTIELVAGTWGVLMALAPLAQVRRLVINRSASDVSLGFLVILQIGFVFYLAYGMSIENRLLIVTNTVSILTNGATLTVAMRLRRPYAS